MLYLQTVDASTVVFPIQHGCIPPPVFCHCGSIHTCLFLDRGCIPKAYFYCRGSIHHPPSGTWVHPLEVTHGCIHIRSFDAVDASPHLIFIRGCIPHGCIPPLSYTHHCGSIHHHLLLGGCIHPHRLHPGCIHGANEPWWIHPSSQRASVDASTVFKTKDCGCIHTLHFQKKSVVFGTLSDLSLNAQYFNLLPITKAFHLY